MADYGEFIVQRLITHVIFEHNLTGGYFPEEVPYILEEGKLKRLM